ncbi:MAG: AAA family ATPase [Bacteroidetes bacterium HGW-Bacteroidetes-7]|jgi:predicted ATPase|nr:MAG: AAA family ATPase [Bacteroidetes bacterium HGW-Bacteroidetes-7]
MKITIKQKYKSINPPCDFELPDFSVLTGRNGSGKTHLLEAILNKDKSDVNINGEIKRNIRYIPFNGLNPYIQETCDPNSITQQIKNIWNQYNSARQNSTRIPQDSNMQNLLRHIGDENAKRLIEKTINETHKEFDKLTEDDLSDNFDISFMGQNDFFTAQFALIFKNYHKRQEENNINEYYVSKGQIPTKPVLSKQEFEDKFGTPPWDFVNKILFETNIPYEVNSPIGTRIESNFNFKLKDRTAGFEISSADLSTGEKVLMSLALAIYNTGGDVGKPDLLLLDEPDAGLHPSLSQKMVDVLNKNIVIENKIPTIITTHSPTTVIASKGVSIYQLIRGNNIPTKVSTQEAVEILSCDIPFLKISTDKRRQVFVESKYDVQYYEQLLNIFSRFVSFNAEPIFIPARTSNGSNCTDVIEVVKNLSDNGNDQIFGVIDWDLVNNSNGRIIVLGENKRYAIENYLLDPLLMGLLFIRETKINIADFIGLSINNYGQVANLTIGDAQIIIDKVLLDLNLNTGNNLQYSTINNWNLIINESFLKHQGHDLETLYKSKYPFLNIYQREDSLKKDIINKVINDFPDFTSKDLLETMLKIK